VYASLPCLHAINPIDLYTISMNFPARSFTRSCAHAFSHSRKDTHLCLSLVRICPTLRYKFKQGMARSLALTLSSSLSCQDTHIPWRRQIQTTNRAFMCHDRNWKEIVHKNLEHLAVLEPHQQPLFAVFIGLFSDIWRSLFNYSLKDNYRKIWQETYREVNPCLCVHPHASVRCSELQCVALWWSTLELLCVVHHNVFAVICSVTRHTQPLCRELQCIAVCCSVLQYAWAHSSPCVRVDY